jgi:aminopeptidase
MTIVPNFQTVVDPQKLEKLAEVAIKVGLRLEKGQDLVITAPLAALPLVRLLTKHAYIAGAGIVSTFYSDEETTLARYEYASDASFDKASDWLYDGMAKAYANGAARLAISGDNPMMLSGQDPAKVARANKANSIAYKPALEKIANFDINWNIVSYPNPSWARQVFPDVPEDVAVGKLADAIFAASRVDLVRSDRGLGRTQRQSQEALDMAQRRALFRTPLYWPWHRSDGRACRRPRMAWRRLDSQERHYLQPEHPD